MTKAPSVFDQHLGLMIWDVERAIAREFAVRAAALGIASGLTPFLRVLESEDGITQREIADRVRMRGSTTAKALGELERDRLVTRQPSEDDGRKIIVWLTKEGRDLCRRLEIEAALFNRRLVSGITQREEKALRRALSKIRNNLS
ncbi:MAG: MarR family transcriptional regulator [Proteobacteria bacterium]|nr:MarR family transcriptional regulator [Pseudomonadota bacterium]